MDRRVVFWFLLIALVISSAGSVRGQSYRSDYDRYFPALKFKSLHISISGLEWMGSKIGSHFRFVPLKLKRNFYATLGWFPIDASSRYRGYLLGDRERQCIQLYLIDMQKDSLLLSLEVAKYSYLPGAMRSIKNSWLMDTDGDGSMEILTVEHLEDFEMETADAPNISGTKSYCHRLVNGKIEYQSLPAGLTLGPLKR